MIGKKIIYGCEARGDADSPYLTRYTLVSTRWFQLCVHVFHRSDADELHDHPWNFWTLILWRGYDERVSSLSMPHSSQLLHHRAGAFLYRPAEHMHRVILREGKPAVTLVLMTKRRREWGFMNRRGTWQQWQEYFRQMRC
jgi:hypothetical protein